jgi:hypothetical protein
MRKIVYLIILFSLTVGPSAHAQEGEYATPNIATEGLDISFSQPLREGGYLQINYISDLLTGIYQYLIGLSITAAIVMVMIGGVQYVVAGAASSQVQKAKERMMNATIGLVLMLSVYVILYTVNPQLTIMQPVGLQMISERAVEGTVQEATRQYEEMGGKELSQQFNKCNADQFFNPDWPDRLVDAVNNASNQTGVDPILIATHIEKETGGDMNFGTRRGPCGEIGPSQFMPTSYETITGNTQCCQGVSVKPADNHDQEYIGNHKEACAGNLIEWPPSEEDMGFECDTNACGKCEIAGNSCVQDFNTPQNLERTVTVTAQFINYLLGKSTIDGDYVKAITAYNGSGAGARAYAEDAIQIYEEFCEESR